MEGAVADVDEGDGHDHQRQWEDVQMTESGVAEVGGQFAGLKLMSREMLILAGASAEEGF